MNRAFPSAALAAAGRGPWGLAALSGVLLALSFPCHPDHPLAALYGGAWAWVGLVPLLVALRGSDSPGLSFRLGWVAGLILHLLSLYWVAHTQGGGPAVVGGAGLMAAYLGLYTGLVSAAVHMALRRWGLVGLLAAPPLWTAAEYLLSLGELAFPWLLLGHSQARFPALVQGAEYTGVYGITFAVVLVNALLALAVIGGGRARRRALAAALAATALVGGHGAAVLHGAPPGDQAGSGLRVAVVQNNMGLEKWRSGGVEASFVSLEALSRQGVAAGADLLVWPETAVPCNLGWSADCRQRVRALSAALGAGILTGAPDTDGDTGEPYNAAFLFRPGALDVPSYAKMHLVPFGERTPFRDRIPFLRDINWSALTGDLGPAEFAPGRRRTLFAIGAGGAPSAETAQVTETAQFAETARFAVLICFESVFPDHVRRSVAEGADFLVNITNDSWFGQTAGPFQHADLTVLRAVENRIAIARCATSGVSLFVDPYGRTRLRTALGEPAVRVGDIGRRQGTSFYTRHGDLFARACLVFSLLLVAAAHLPRRAGFCHG